MESSIESFLEGLRKYFIYDEVTGEFANRITGQIVGHLRNDGYIQIYYKGHLYLAHKLAWLYVYGEWALVDHKKGNSNAITNLRKATPQQNAWNRSAGGINFLGVRGVQQRGEKFRAYITVNYRYISLGTFETLEGAINARKSAEDKYFGEFKFQD